ncbi:hypothetical protein BJF93_16660 [Xaviernesmea oryzae]|uniref:Uncharacterized protein n=2 Tax=Xaviernesmea oryzae TaxID=464029 RepID=A0A1Q9ASY9_9HYPH|nr:hypothetical protein BJF93_16660 [Xaviernesmea oryzae]
MHEGDEAMVHKMNDRRQSEETRLEGRSLDQLIADCREDGESLGQRLHVFDAGIFDRALLDALVKENRKADNKG